MNEDAIVAIDAALKLDPTIYDAYYYKGQAWLNIGNVANACGNWKIAQHKPSEKLSQAIKKNCKNTILS
jgi:tetratricopeptide (TPR) repeat protein